MANVDTFLETILDSLYYYSKTSYQLSGQLESYLNQYNIGTPNTQFSNQLDKSLPIGNPPNANFQPYLSYNGLTGYQNLKQDNNLNLTSWTPDQNIFTNEGVGTLEYTCWNNEPLNNFTGSQKIQRLTHNYNSRILPLLGLGNSFTEIDFFQGGFWASISSNVTSGNAITFQIDKTFFNQCNFFDNHGIPQDVKIYYNSNLISSFTSGAWAPISLAFYDTLSTCNFTILSYNSQSYTIKLDLPINLSNSYYAHFLILAGSNYIPIKTPSTFSPSASAISAKFTSPKIFTNQIKPSISIPKTYPSFNINGIYNSNIYLNGLTGSLQNANYALLINQNQISENGLYITSTGSWYKINNFINNFSFIKSTVDNYTGSKILLNNDNYIIDAPENNLNIYTSDINNLNPEWLYNNFNSYSIQSVDYAGPIYDSFSFKNYSYNVEKNDSAGITEIDYSESENNWTDNPLIIPKGQSILHFDNLNYKIGDIIQTSLNNIGTIFLIKNNLNFAIAKLNYGQIIIQKIIGQPFDNINIYTNAILYYNIIPQINSNFINLLEPYESQLYNTLMVHDTSQSSSDLTYNINFVNAIDKGASTTEIKKSSYNSNWITQLSRKYGRLVDSNVFKYFTNLSTKKNNPPIAAEGSIISPVINYMDKDLDLNYYTYEYISQISKVGGKKTFINNSSTNYQLANEEFDFNYLNNESTNGESSSSYSAPSPYFTGPNLLVDSENSDSRIKKRNQYGNLYQVNESVNTNEISNIQTKYSKLNLNTNSYNQELLSQNIFSGSAISGVNIANKLNILSYPSHIADNSFSSSTLYSVYTGSQLQVADLLFSGNTIYIPIPAINYSGLLKTIQIQMKVIGQNYDNGFLRASIVDLASYFSGNDTNQIETLISSDLVTTNYLNNSYQPVYFSFDTDAQFLNRNNYNQFLYIAIQKTGDVSNSELLIKTANSSSSSLYSIYSGSVINTNLQYSTSFNKTTGSSIYSLYKYNSPTVLASRLSYPNQQIFGLVYFPYIENSNNISQNTSSEAIHVTFTNTGSSASLNNISLDQPMGSQFYSFITPYGFTGSSYINIGTASDALPNGYNLFLTASKITNDNLPNALQEYERNLVVDTQQIPELFFIISQNNLVGSFNSSNFNSAIMGTVKSSVINNGAFSRDQFLSNSRKYSYIVPPVSYSSSYYNGLSLNKKFDFIFIAPDQQYVERKQLSPSAGISTTAFVGTPNGIVENISQEILLKNQFLNQTILDNSQLNSNLILTVIYLNYISQGNENNMKITLGQNSLWRYHNLNQQINQSGQGPTAIFSISSTAGILNNNIIYIYGPKSEQNNIKIEFNTNSLSSYQTFSLTNSSMFPQSLISQTLTHPSNISLADILQLDDYQKKNILFKRYSR